MYIVAIASQRHTYSWALRPFSWTLRRLLSFPALLAFSAGILSCSLGSATTAPVANIRTVARHGQLAPGTNQTFGSFVTTPPSVNIHGDVAFRASFTQDGPQGIWAERGPLGLRPVALPGQPAPGVPGKTFAYMGESNSPLSFNNAGQIVFRAMFGGGGFNNDGLWFAQPDGTLEFIARSGDRVSGSSKPVVQFQRYISLNQQGDVSFRGRYTTSFTNDAGLFMYRGPGTTSLIGETFDSVPGEGSSLFKEYAFEGALLDGAGRAFFKASPGTASGEYTGADGIYMFDGELKKLVREEESIPGTEGRLIFDSIYPFELAINSHGQFAFGSSLRGLGVTTFNDLALFRGAANGSAEEVLREGTQANGLADGVQFESFYSPELNVRGQLAFIARLRGPGISSLNDESVWVETPTGDFHMVAQEGSEAPEAPENVFFGDIFNRSRVFGGLVINANGQVAFRSLLNGTGLGNTSGNLNQNGIWATDIHGDLRSIVIAGQPFMTTELDTRTHGLIFFAGDTGNDEGLASGFSDSGHVAFQGYFGNNAALYLSSKVVIPEPTSAVLLAAAFTAIATFRCHFANLRASSIG